MTVTALDDRRATIGGSEAAAACGVDPYRSQIMLWARKTGKLPEPPESEAMRWGKLLEPVILAELEEYGFDLLPAPAEGFRDGYRVGHPDAFATKDGRRLIVDAKTTGPWSSHKWDEADAPTSYVLQLHHYMALTGDTAGVLACLIAGQRLEVRIVERDDTVVGLMLEGEARFMEFVRRNEPPPVDGSSDAAEALRGMFPGEKGTRMRLDRAGMRLIEEYKLRDRAYQASKRQRDELKQAIQLAMGDAEVALTLSDEVAAKWTTFVRDGKPQRRFTVA